MNYQRPLRFFARDVGLYLFSTITVGTIEHLEKEFDAGTLTREKLLAAYKEDFKRPMAIRLLNRASSIFEVYRKRAIVLRDGLRAHFNGQFNLSVPCLLPQIEGMLVEASLTQTATPSVRVDGYDKRLAFEYQDYAAEFNAFLSDMWKGRPSDDAFNRNPILHGANPRYGREDWSLVISLAVIEIYFFLYAREKSQVVIP